MGKSSFPIFVLFLFVVGCSSGSSGPGAKDSNDQQGLGSTCNYVVTNEAISKLNSTSQKFRVSGAGYNTTCSEELDVNGNVQKVQREGYTAVKVYPKITVRNFTVQQNRNFFFDAQISGELTQDEKNEILSSLNVAIRTDDANQVSIFRPDQLSAGMIRLADSILIPFYGFQENGQKDTKFNYTGQLEVRQEVAGFVAGLLQQANQNGRIEVIWRFDSNMAILAENVADLDFPKWQNENTEVTLKKYVSASSHGILDYIYESAIDYVYSWAFTPNRIHTRLPELYGYANDFLKDAQLNVQNQGKFQHLLRYVTDVNPNHPLAAIARLSQRLSPYTAGFVESFSTAKTWIENRTYSEDQIQIILNTSEKIRNIFGGQSLGNALEVIRFANREQSKIDFAVTVLNRLSELKAIDTSQLVAETFRKLNHGLKQENMELYFSTIQKLSPWPSRNVLDAVSKSDAWVLDRNYSASEVELYIDFAGWIKEKTYKQLNDSIDIVEQLLQLHKPNTRDVESYKKLFTFLTDNLYLNKQQVIDDCKELYRINRVDEISIAKLKDLASYLKDTLYQSRDVAWNNTKNLIIEKGLQPAEVEKFKSFVNWLVETLYLSRSDSFERAVKYVSSGLDGDKITALKAYVGYAVETIYLSKRDALDRGEKVVLEKKLNSSQVNLVKESASWLVEEIYISRREALDRADSYLVEFGLNEGKWKALKDEYQAGYSRNYNKRRALEEAELKVLGRK